MLGFYPPTGGAVMIGNQSLQKSVSRSGANIVE